jgi:putative ABC transport system permease protein
MNLFIIAKKNLKKNFSFYSLYLFSVAFVLMVFFSFVSFSMNNVIMERISSDGRVETMCKTISIFIIAFVLFYMSYSNTFFTKRRMRELGIYALLGYRKSAMLKLLTFENVFICFASLFIAIIMGAFIHKGIITVIVHLMDLQIDTAKIPLFNLKAVIFSSLFVLAVLFVLFLSNWKLLRKNSLLNLVRLEKSVEKQIKLKFPLALLGLLLLVFGYALALDLTRGKNSLWVTIGFSPIALLTLLSVVMGTILFINAFLPYILSKIKNKKGYFYQETNIITIPKFIYRIRSNAKALILLTLLSAITLTILGSTILSMYYSIAGLSRVIPTSVEFRIEKPIQAKQALQTIKGIVGKKTHYQKKLYL